ncbi:MAG: hypothetical protein WC975_07300 [Phycisphaerae bacterium]
MTWYRLMFGGTQLGDEIIQGMGSWRKGTGSTTGSAGLEPIAKLDDRPLAMILYPRFRLRKQTQDQWEFEKWVFDLLTWADGERRDLMIVKPDWCSVVDYGNCKLISLERPDPPGPQASRWSDQVILTFQSDTQPYFYSS